MRGDGGIRGSNGGDDWSAGCAEVGEEVARNSVKGRGCGDEEGAKHLQTKVSTSKTYEHEDCSRRLGT